MCDGGYSLFLECVAQSVDAAVCCLGSARAVCDRLHLADSAVASRALRVPCPFHVQLGFCGTLSWQCWHLQCDLTVMVRCVIVKHAVLAM